MNPKLRIIFFFLTASALLFCRLGGAPLFDPDEGRYSDIAHTMLKTGDWLTPRMDGISHYHKPPLSNWLVAASFKTFGKNEFAARFPSVILSLGLLAVLISLGKFLFNFETGYYSAWILLTSGLYVATSRLVTTDMLLTFLTFFSMNCIARVILGSSKKVFWFYGAVLGLALAMLTKGPVAWMITLLPAVIFSVWKKKKAGISWYHWVIGFILFWAISLSWYLAVVIQNKGALDYFLHYQLAGRIIKGTAGRKHGFFYYFLVLPLGFMPWTIFIPSSLRWISKQSWSTEIKERLQFILFWFVVPFICFTIFKTKLATYIVPLIPPLALLSGFFWAQWNAGKVTPSIAMKRSAQFLSVTYALIAAAGIVLFFLKLEVIHGISMLSIFMTAALLLSASAVNLKILHRQEWSLVYPAQVATWCLIGWIALSNLPSIEYKNAKVFAQKLQTIKEPGDKIVMWKNYYASLPFYLDERVATVAVDMETTFEPKKNTEGYVYDNSGDITHILETPGRVFILTNKKTYNDLLPFAKVTLYPILEKQKIVLVSNKPEHA